MWLGRDARLGGGNRRLLARLRADRHGSIAILAAASFILLITSAGIALDLSKLYIAKSSVQRIADQSAIAAALAYTQSSYSSSTATSAAQSMATSNGASNATVTASVVAAPSGDGNNAVMVVVSVPVTLSPFVTTAALAGPSVTVAASAYAEVHPTTAAPCIIALGSGGITDSSYVSDTATECSISSAGKISKTGSTLTGLEVHAAGAITTSGSTVKSSPTAGLVYANSTNPTDPFANDNVFSRLTTVAALTAPSAPSIGSAPSGGTAQNCTGVLSLSPGSYGTITASSACTVITFTGGSGTTTNVSGSGLNLTTNFSQALTINFCPGTFNLNGISISSVITVAVTVNVTTSPLVCGTSIIGSTVLNVWNGIAASGKSLTVNGPATYNVLGGITAGNSATLAFTNLNGLGTSTFNIAGGITMAGNSSFPDGTYTISSPGSNHYGIYSTCACTITFGNGSYDIAYGIYLGSSTFSIGNAASLNANGTFVIPCSYASGGGCDATGYAINSTGSNSITFGSYTNYDLNGSFAMASGSLTLGSGIYTVNGNFTTPGNPQSISGSGVSIIASGAISLSIGGSGNGLNLSAPSTITSLSSPSTSSIVLATNSTSASSMTIAYEDAVILGAVYMPNAALTLYPTNNLSGGSGGCLMLVASSITDANDGGKISTDCSGAESTSSVSLVQ